MMVEVKFKTFGNFAVLNKALLFLIKLNDTAVQSLLRLMLLSHQSCKSSRSFWVGFRLKIENFSSLIRA